MEFLFDFEKLIYFDNDGLGLLDSEKMFYFDENVKKLLCLLIDRFSSNSIGVRLLINNLATK